MSDKKRKHCCVTIKQKLDILKQLEAGTKAKRLAAEYGIGVNTVHDIKKSKDKLLRFSLTSSDSIFGNRKTMKKSPYELLNKALLQWFNSERALGHPVTGPLCIKQAKTLFETLGLEGNFDASSGWLARFKDRHGIRTIGDSMDCLWTRADAPQISGEGGEESLKSGETPCDGENVQSEEPATSQLVSKEDQNNESVEENSANPMENLQNVEESPSQEPTTVEKTATQTNPAESAADAPEEPNSNESDFTNLKSVVKRLEVIHDKLSLIALGDSCDQFGKYVSSLLRGLPPKKVLSLKQKIVTDVLDVLLAHERGLSENVLSIGTDSPSNKKKTTNSVANSPFTFVGCNPEADDSLYTPLKDSPRNSRGNSHAVKPKPPQVQKLVNIEETCLPPLVPINSSPLRLMPMLPFPANTLTRVLNPVAGNQMPRCETMPSSYDGTPLLHLKLPMRDSPTAGSGSVTNTSTKSRRGRKRKQTPSTEAVDWSKPEEEEFKIDIEEGKELLGMKQDLEMYETVVCGSDLVEVKQEAPDPEEECEESPPHQEYLVLEPTRLYLCDICSEQCATMTDLTTHFTQQHSGCVPIFKDQSEESILPSAKKQCI